MKGCNSLRLLHLFISDNKLLQPSQVWRVPAPDCRFLLPLMFNTIRAQKASSEWTNIWFTLCCLYFRSLSCWRTCDWDKAVCHQNAFIIFRFRRALLHIQYIQDSVRCSKAAPDHNSASSVFHCRHRVADVTCLLTVSHVHGCPPLPPVSAPLWLKPKQMLRPTLMPHDPGVFL